MEKIGNRDNTLRTAIAFTIPEVIAGEYFDRFSEYTDDYDKDCSVEHIDIYCQELSDLLDEEFGIKECVYDAMFRLTVLSTLVDTMLESQYNLYYGGDDDEYYFFSEVDYDRETKVFRAEITCKRR